MAKARWFLPATLLLAAGLVFMIDPETTGLTMLAELPGGNTLAYVVCIALGLLLGVQAFNRLYDEEPQSMHLHSQPNVRPVTRPIPREAPQPIFVHEENQPYVDEQNAKDGFVSISSSGQDSTMSTTDKHIIRPFQLKKKDDIEVLRGMLRSGPHVILVDISKVRHIPDLKEWFRQLQNTVKALGGGLVGLDTKHVLVTSQATIKK